LLKPSGSSREEFIFTRAATSDILPRTRRKALLPAHTVTLYKVCTTGYSKTRQCSEQANNATQLTVVVGGVVGAPVVRGAVTEAVVMLAAAATGCLVGRLDGWTVGS
jgi:hypothetical protein